MAKIFDGLRLPFRRSRHHNKLGEGWGENKEPVADGVTFYVKYLGSTLVDEISQDSGKSYGEGISAEAVRTVVTMAKSKGKKLQKVSLNVSPKGIAMVDLVSGKQVRDTTIDRIRFCTADGNYEKVFAFIARSYENETMECHAYLCAKKKMAQAVTLSVSQAFNLAYDQWKTKRGLTGTTAREDNFQLSNNSVQNNLMFNKSVSPPVSPTRPSVNGADFESIPPPLLPPTGVKSPAPQQPSLMSPTRQNGTQQPVPRQNWVSFDDDCGPGLFDSRTQDPFRFSTNLRQEEIDEDVHNFMDQQRCLEAFSGQKSIDDLLDL